MTATRVCVSPDASRSPRSAWAVACGRLGHLLLRYTSYYRYDRLPSAFPRGPSRLPAFGISICGFVLYRARKKNQDVFGCTCEVPAGAGPRGRAGRLGSPRSEVPNTEMRKPKTPRARPAAPGAALIRSSPISLQHRHSKTVENNVECDCRTKNNRHRRGYPESARQRPAGCSDVCGLHPDGRQAGR